MCGTEYRYMITSIIEYGHKSIYRDAELVYVLNCLGVRDVFCDNGLLESYMELTLQHFSSPVPHMGYDERITGFQAMGCLKASESPVAVIVSTMHGLANLAPMLMEIQGQRTPLIVISTDEGHDVPESLTGSVSRTDPYLANFCEYVQINYANERLTPTARTHRIINAYRLAEARHKPLHVRISPEIGMFSRITLDEFTDDVSSFFNEEFISRLMALREEVYSCFAEQFFKLPDDGKSDETLLTESNRNLKDNLNSMSRNMTDTDPKLNLLRQITDSRTLVFAGALTATEAEPVEKYLAGTGFPVYADVQSNLRGRKNLNLITDFDEWYRNHPPVAYLNGQRFAETRPEDVRTTIGYNNLPFDYILILGGRFISKTILEFLSAKKENIVQVFMNDDVISLNASGCRGVALKDSYEVLPYLLPVSDGISRKLPVYGSDTGVSERETRELNALKRTDIADEESFYRLLNLILKPKQRVFLGNSLSVRMAEKRLHTANMILTNRVVSGIDGLIATAAGIAMNGETVAVIGDTSALYDLSSLGLLRNVSLKLIILNNNGGRIFTRFPLPTEKLMKESFINPHGLNFSHFCRAFGISYACVTKFSELKDALTGNGSGSCVIEVDLTAKKTARKAAGKRNTGNTEKTEADDYFSRFHRADRSH